MVTGFYAGKVHGATRVASVTCPHVMLSTNELGKKAMMTLKAGNGLQKTEQGDTVEISMADDVPALNSNNTFTSVNDTDTTNEFDIVNAKEVNITSDRRLKSDIQPLEDIVDNSSASRMLHSIPVYRYRLRKQANRLHLGVMADEYYASVSGVLNQENDANDGYKTVNYNHLVMLLLLNTQRLERRVSALERDLLHSRVERPTHDGANVIPPDVVACNG